MLISKDSLALFHEYWTMRAENSEISQVAAGGAKGRTHRFLLSGEKEWGWGSRSGKWVYILGIYSDSSNGV